MKSYFSRTFVLLILIGSTFHSSFAQVNRRDTRRNLTYQGNFQRISAGSTHALEIRGGTLWAWGDNYYGELGDGTFVRKSSPVQIGSDNNWVTVSAGGYFSMAIKADGTLWSWGTNIGVQGGNVAGMLGNGTAPGSISVPVQVGTDNHWISVAAGDYHTLALKSDGTLWVWGYNGEGELGIGSTACKSTPYQLGTDNKWVYISAGGGHSNAIKADGTMWGWGFNGDGETGDGTTAQRNSPVQAGTDNKWVSVAAGTYYTMALKSDGTLWTCGWSGQHLNQIGTGNTWVSYFGGYMQFGAIRSDGTLWMWGYNNYGQVGDGTTTTRANPVQIGTGTDWVSFGASAGGYYTSTSYATRADGSLWTWGLNTSGQMGDGTLVNKWVPTMVHASDHVVSSISGGSGFATGVNTDGTMWGWGSNYLGQVGDGTTIARTSPVQVGTATNWHGMNSGDSHTIAIQSNGTLWAWGCNQYGQLGDGTTSSHTIPNQIGTANDWAAVFAGGSSSMAIKANGTLWAWGQNNLGQLGDGTFVDKHSPVQIGTDNEWVSVGISEDHVLGLKSNGTLWAWGANYNGALGDGTTNPENAPMQVGTDNKWIGFRSGDGFTVAEKSDGTLWACGYNADGELGIGSLTNQLTLVQVGTDNDWILQTATGGDRLQYSYALKSNGTLWSWGSNFYGAAGDGTVWTIQSPVQIGSSLWSGVYSAGVIAFGLQPTRDPFCATGDNSFGELGDGTTVSKNTFACGTILTRKSGGGGLPTGRTAYRGEDVQKVFEVYPSPTSDNLTMQYQVETEGLVSLRLTNMLGQESVLLNTTLLPGAYSNHFNAKELNLSPGIYFATFVADSKMEMVKICIKD
jgi:alpha-tubulin suppressor-like RCC1 family protein